MSAAKVKVVYIAGSGRSGSTLLDRVLGEAPGFVPAGELRSIWSWGIRPSARCGCGTAFRECAFWQSVFNEACGGLSQLERRASFPWGYPELRRTDIPRLALPLRSRSFSRALEAHVASLQALYTALAKVSGGRGIIDSSKRFEYAYLLSAVPNLDLYVVHLVRDSRAVTSSELRRAVGKTVGSYAEALGLLAKRAAAWAGNQMLSELLRSRGVNYMLLRYEDFASEPAAALTRIGAFIHEDLSELKLVDNRSIQFSSQHTALGSNYVRLQQGAVDIRLDEAWRERMEATHRWLVTAFTWPLLWRYGYLRSQADHAPAMAPLV